MMKLYKTLLTAALLGAALEASAQLPTSGVWSATTIAADETVTLDGDIDLQGTITINQGITLTVKIADGVSGDVSIRRSADVTMFTVNGTLEIQGSSDTKRVVIDGNYSSGSGNTGYGIYGNNALTNISLDYAVLQNIYRSESSSTSGSAVYMGSTCAVTSSFTMKNSAVQDSYYAGSKSGGIMFFSSSQSSDTNVYYARFEDCTFENNNVTATDTNAGGVIFGDSSKSIDVQVISCTFENNKAASRGAAINWRSDYPGLSVSGSTFSTNEASLGGAIAIVGAKGTITGSSFTGNKATGTHGGAIWGNGSLTLDGCTFNGNEATKQGGAVYSTKGVSATTILTLRNHCSFVSNTAGTDGGAIAFYRTNDSNNCEAYLSEVTFQENTANTAGGGLYCGGDKNITTVDIQNSSFTDNTSTTSNGGGIAVTKYIATFNINNTTFENNTAALNGGGLATTVSLKNVTVSGSDFTTNTATNNGGAAYFAAGTAITITGGALNNNSAQNGGVFAFVPGNATTAIVVNGAAEFTNNTASADGGAIYFLKGQSATATLSVCESCNFTTNTAGANGGAIAFYRNNSDNSCTASLNQLTIDSNTANAAGGGLYFAGSQNITKVEILNSKILNNTSETSNGGGIAVARYIATFNLTDSKIQHNTAALNGGGFSADGVSLVTANITGTDFTLNTATAGNGGGMYISGRTVTVSGGTISGNSALNGGGIALKSCNTTALSILGDCAITSNNATAGDGGAIYFEKNNSNDANLTVGACTISSNSATNGGAIATYKTNTSNSMTATFNAGSISSNTAAGNGGGLYMTGGGTVKFLGSSETHSVFDGNRAVDGAGVYLTNSVAGTYNYGEMKNNIATGNGGGFYISGGTQTFTVSTSSVNYNYVIKGNRAVNGAGLYLDTATAKLHSGEVKNNVASGNGGGIYAVGGTQTFTGLSASEYFIAKDNTARNGAGMYLSGAAAATIKWAQFTSNHAVAENPISSAYHSDPTYGDIQGAGGGIYVATGSSESARTKLTFSDYASIKVFGIYNNIADNCGSEILADGAYTQLTLPTTDLSSITLLGTGLTASGWYEDYVDGDVNYSLGTAKGSEGGRYPTIITPLLAASANTVDTYSCITIGFSRAIIIKAQGLHKDENAFFTLTKKDSSEPYERFALTGISDAGDEVTREIYNLEPGIWIVKESGWGWSYTTDPSSREIEHSLDSEDTSVEYVFKFTKSSTVNSTETKAKNEFEINGFRIDINVNAREDKEGGIIGL